MITSTKTFNHYKVVVNDDGSGVDVTIIAPDTELPIVRLTLTGESVDVKINTAAVTNIDELPVKDEFKLEHE